MRLRLFFLSVIWSGAIRAADQPAVWQWSVPVAIADAGPADRTRAFLWIPENCARVRGVVVGQNNMLEEGIFEHATFRRTLAELGFAEVWVAPKLDPVFDFTKGAGERFEAMMRSLAVESGYAELAYAPAVPMGHSACASFPWNFAAWNPARTLAILSVKGDAPQTDLTGSGRPNPDWGDRSIDGVPGLMVMSESEWWDARLAPALAFRAAHPAAPIATLADTGRGHFDASDGLVEFLALFIRKAAETRLPANAPLDGPVGLRPIAPADGWLVDRWRREEAPRAPAAPAVDYTGDRAEALWCFDAEMARAIEVRHAASRGKRTQQVDFAQEDRFAPISSSHAGVELKMPSLADDLGFRLGGEFIEPLPPRPLVAAKDKPPPTTVVTPNAAAPGAHAGGAVRISRITGPVTRVDAETWRVALNRTASTTDRRSYDAWLLAEHPGDGKFKGAVQQASLKLSANVAGAKQTITFPSISDRKTGAKSVKLAAASSAGAPVRYYVREGPAFVDGDTLVFTGIPPRTRWPLRVTVVAWQWGRSGEHALKAAEPVERTFSILP